MAILLVLLWHGLFCLRFQSTVLADLLVVGRLSWSGVDLFFVLSGFLIGGILLDARESPRYYRTFYIRRAYRILPLYGLVIGLSLLWPIPFRLWPGTLGTMGQSPIPLAAFLLFAQNFWMAHLGELGTAALAATWSLAIEEQFYLTVPLLVRTFSRARLCVALTCVVVAAPVLRTLVQNGLKHGHIAAFVLTPCRADALCLGVLAALLVRTPSAWSAVASKRAVLWWVMVGLSVCLALLSHGSSPFTFTDDLGTAGYSLLALFYTCLLLIALTSRGIVQRVLCTPWLMKLGTLAYCTYLLHLLAKEAFQRLLGLRYSRASVETELLSGVLGIALTLWLATLSWKFVERPLLRRGRAHKY